MEKKTVYKCSNPKTFADHHLVDAIRPFFIASIIRVGSPLLMTGSNEAAVGTAKELSMRYIRHPHYIAKWRTGALRVNDDVKAAAGWKTYGAQRIVSRSNSAS